MNSISNEASSVLPVGDHTPRPNTGPVRFSGHDGSFEDVDIIDIMVFLWHARLYILGGMLMGALLGLLYSATRTHSESSIDATVSSLSTASAAVASTYQNEFWLLAKNDPFDNRSLDRINKINELFMQPPLLRIFFEALTKEWPELTGKWAGDERLASSDSFTGFLLKQRAENLIALNGTATSHDILLRLTLKLPIVVDTKQLADVMTDIVSQINATIIAPDDRRASSANQLVMEQIQMFKVELLKQKSRLNKLYFNLLKLSGISLSGVESSNTPGYPPQSEAISVDRVLALMSRMATEKLINAALEAQYYQELIDIQTRVEELPKKIATQSSLMNQIVLEPISLDLSKDHGSLTSNAEILPPIAESPPTPSPVASFPIKSPGFYVVLGLFFGLFVGFMVASIKLFFEKNWDLIKARIDARAIPKACTSTNSYSG